MNDQAGAEEAQYRIQAGLQWRWCLGGVVVLGTDAAEALHVGPPAALWFSRLQRPVTLADLIDSVNVGDEARLADARELLAQLCDLGVVAVVR